jgi:carbonic anhydrase
MLTFTNDQLRDKLADEAGAEAGDVDFQPFSDLDESVRAGVRKIADSPLLPSFGASGYVYDVRSGRLREVA